MQNLSTQTKQTMSSLEISELTGKKHTDVTADIKRILDEAGIEAATFSAPCKMASGQTANVYRLPYRETQLVMSGYSVKHRLAIIDRWQEIEEKQATQALPSYAETLRLYADSLDKIQEKDKLIVATNQAQIAAGEILVREFVKAIDLIELGEKQFFHWMRDNGIISESNEPYQKHVKQGYFTWKPTEEMHGGKFRYQIRITPRGKVWLAAKYMAYLDKQ